MFTPSSQLLKVVHDVAVEIFYLFIDSFYLVVESFYLVVDSFYLVVDSFYLVVDNNQLYTFSLSSVQLLKVSTQFTQMVETSLYVVGNCNIIRMYFTVMNKHTCAQYKLHYAVCCIEHVYD